MTLQIEVGKRYTTAEYLELELSSETRHEYVNGEMVPMTGGTPEHNEIISILNATLRVGLKGQPYSVFASDQRLWIPDRTLYTYPDVMVVSRPLARQPGRSDTVSTKNYDRDEKFSAYRSIPNFQEYLLIDQYTIHLEQYSRISPQQWTFTEYDRGDATVDLRSLPITIVLADLYDEIDLQSS